MDVMNVNHCPKAVVTGRGFRTYVEAAHGLNYSSNGLGWAELSWRRTKKNHMPTYNGPGLPNILLS